MYIYQGAKREPGVGVKEKGCGVGGSSSTDFPTVYMLISNLTALVLEPFIHQMLINFFSFCYRVFCRHLTADGKMLINVCLESFLTELFCWIWVMCCIFVIWFQDSRLNSVSCFDHNRCHFMELAWSLNLTDIQIFFFLHLLVIRLKRK